MTLSQDELLALDAAAMDAASQFMQSGDSRDIPTNRWSHRAVGVILAGGRASRMAGQDKPLISVAGKSLLEQTIDRLAPQVGGLIVSGSGNLERFDTELPVIADGVADFAGPLAGILAAMRWAQHHAPHAYWVISAAVDTPFFPDDLLDRFVMAMGGPEPSVVLAQSGDNIHPTFGLWPVALADDLEAFLMAGERKARLWAEKHNCSHAIFRGPIIDDIEIDPFFNINAPDDIEVAEAIADGLAELVA